MLVFCMATRMRRHFIVTHTYTHSVCINLFFDFLPSRINIWWPSRQSTKGNVAPILNGILEFPVTILNKYQDACKFRCVVNASHKLWKHFISFNGV